MTTHITYKGCHITIGQDDIDPRQWNYSVQRGPETIMSSMKAPSLNGFEAVYHFLKGLIDDDLVFKKALP